MPIAATIASCTPCAMAALWLGEVPAGMATWVNGMGAPAAEIEVRRRGFRHHGSERAG
jgi:hypothetical protein